MTRISVRVMEDRIYVNTGGYGYVFDSTDEAWKEEYDKILEAIETIKKVCESE